MILYPMIELLDGRCVSLFRGRTEEPTSGTSILSQKQRVSQNLGPNGCR
jgi:phosphoribosylformimino-5-aminoimidazole carboxamide ribonucleotide (ProFAR) isomerase